MGVQSVGVEAAPHGPGPRFSHLTDHINRPSQGTFTEGLESRGLKFWADANRMGPYVFGSSMAKQATEGSNSEGTQSSSQKSFDKIRFGGIAGASSLSSTGGGCVSRTVSVSELLAFRNRGGKVTGKQTPTVPIDPGPSTSSIPVSNVCSSGANPNGTTTASPIFSSSAFSNTDGSGPTFTGFLRGASAAASGDPKYATSSFSSFGAGVDSAGSYPRQFVFSAGTESGTGPSKPATQANVSLDNLFSGSFRPATESNVSTGASFLVPSKTNASDIPFEERLKEVEAGFCFEKDFSAGTAPSVTAGLPKPTTQVKGSLETDQSLPMNLARKLNQLDIDKGANLLPKLKKLDLNKDAQETVKTSTFAAETQASTSVAESEVEQKLKRLEIDEGASLTAKLNKLDVNKEKDELVRTNSFVFGSRSTSENQGGAASGTVSGAPFVFGATTRSPARAGSVPLGTGNLGPVETPPTGVPNLSSPFKFSADREARPPVPKSKKDKFQHRPLRPGLRPNVNGMRSAAAIFRGKAEATTPSPNREGVQDSSQPSTRFRSGSPNCDERLVPEYDEEDGEVENGRFVDLSSLSELEASIEKLRAAAENMKLGSKAEGPKENPSSAPSFKAGEESFRWGEDAALSNSASLGQSWKRTSHSDARTAEREEQENSWGQQGNTTNDANDRSDAKDANAGSERNEVTTEAARDPEGANCSDPGTTSRVDSEGKTAESPFKFTASPSGMSTSNLRRRARRVQREKSVGRVAQAEKSPAAVLQPDTSNSRPFPSVRSDTWSGAPTFSGLKGLGFGEGVNTPGGIGAVAAEQVCERWRLRGNQAYAKGDFVKAEEFYSLGAGSVSPHETSQSCIRALMLCYSNRAATRMVVGRMREALADCMHAMAIDSSFFRVHLRAASCHLALGETELAVAAFKEILRQAKEAKKLDSKVLADASDGLKKAQQVVEYTAQVRKLLQNNSSGETVTALRLLNEALLSSPQSERLLELKALALLSLQRYSEAVQLCDQSLTLAEQNHVTPEGAGMRTENSPLGWRQRITAKASFHLGKLEESLELLQLLEEGPSSMFPPDPESVGALSAEMAVPSTAVIRDLLRHKLEGNKAFQAGKHAEALEHYTAALARNGESRPFCAVCLCNRAAASQALGHIADAIADCSRAIALDPRYAKAISRRAALHEKVRDYGQSCSDLRRLITLYEKQPQTQDSSSQKLSGSRDSSAGPTSSSVEELQQAKERLVKSEEELKKGHPLDHYSILGLELGCSANEIKKAYRKAALRHHPDKAGQFLVRSGDIGDDPGAWKDVNDETLRKDGERLIDEVRRDSEQLFKLIGEAYAILSDPSKRSRYDAEEELRKLRTRTNDLARTVFNERKHSRTNDGANGGQSKGGWGGGGSVGGEAAGSQSRASRQRERWDGFNYQYQRWHPGPDAAQADVYARRGWPAGSTYGSSHRSTPWRWEDYQWDDV